MTFAEMGEQFDLEIDESGGYWFNNTEKSAFLNKATDKFVNMFYERFEVDEGARARLRPLIKDSAAQIGSVFNLSVITDLYFILKMRGVFTVTAGGSSHSITRQINPQQIDDLTDQDPFGVGTNSDPHYEEVGDTLVVKSDSAPTNVIVTYLKTPTVIDIDGSPGSSIEIPASFHNEIVDLARDMALENVNSPRYPTAKNETKENL